GALEVSQRADLVSRVVAQQTKFIVGGRILFMQPELAFKMADGLAPIFGAAPDRRQRHSGRRNLRFLAAEMEAAQMIVCIRARLTDGVDERSEKARVFAGKIVDGTFGQIDVESGQALNVDLRVKKLQ